MGSGANINTKKFKFVGLITARKGSTRLPGKNVKLLCGKPMIEYTILAAINSKLDEVIVTTDDEKVKKIAKSYSLEIVDRPPELATKDAEISPVILHAIKDKNVKVVLLHPTSPLRISEDIDKCIETYKTGCFDAVITVKEVNLNVYASNGAVYVFSMDLLLKDRFFYEHFYNLNTGLVIMPSNRSADVDTYEDFKIAETLMKARYDNQKRLQ